MLVFGIWKFVPSPMNTTFTELFEPALKSNCRKLCEPRPVSWMERRSFGLINLPDSKPELYKKYANFLEWPPYSIDALFRSALPAPSVTAPSLFIEEPDFVTISRM